MFLYRDLISLYISEINFSVAVLCGMPATLQNIFCSDSFVVKITINLVDQRLYHGFLLSK
jgi:hypothetical protein